MCGKEVKGQFRRLELSPAGKAMVFSGQAHELSVRIDLCRPSAVRDVYHLIRVAVDNENRPVIEGNLPVNIKIQQLFGVNTPDLLVEYL